MPTTRFAFAGTDAVAADTEVGLLATSEPIELTAKAVLSVIANRTGRLRANLELIRFRRGNHSNPPS
jgi:hypothetical protein